MPRQNTVEIIIQGKDATKGAIASAKGGLGGLKTALSGIGKVAAGAFLGISAGAAAAAGGILKLAADAAAIEPIERDFARLSESIGETGKSILTSLREASYGMVSNADLMQAANRLISMGLAESSEEAGEFTRMAVRLGEAMGKGPTEAMEEFALMMANQSIPRLDTFGISAGKVRARIKELMEANEDLSREEAFATAVREEGQKSLERIGEGGKGAAASMARLRTMFTNVKDTVGKAFIPVLAAVLEPLGQLAQKYGPMVIEWAEQFSAWLQTVGVPTVQAFVASFSEFASQAIPVIRQTATVIAGQLAPVVQQIAQFMKANLIPAFEQIVASVQGNMTPVLAGLAAMVAAVVIPAFVAWAASAVAAAVATVAALAPVLVPILAIGAAVAALVLAWQRDWGGIRTFMTNLWTNTLQPIFQTIQEWLATNIPLAIAALAGFWQNTLLPAVQAVADFWTNTLLPALQAFWAFTQDYLIPLGQAFLGVLVELGKLGFEVLAGIWQNVLQPALAAMWEWVSTKLIPVVGDLITKVVSLATSIAEKVSPPIKSFRTAVLEPLAGTMDSIKSAISGVIDWLNKLKDAIGNISLPSFLQPGSASPFEHVLEGVAENARLAARALDTELAASLKPTLNVGGSLAGAGAGAGSGRNVVIAHIHLDSRQYTDVRGQVDYSAINDFLLSVEKGL